jgi:hypothetical protein
MANNIDELDNELDKLIAEAEAERDNNDNSKDNNEEEGGDIAGDSSDNDDNSSDTSDEDNSEEGKENKDETTGDEDSEESADTKKFKPVEVQFGQNKITLDSEEEVAKYLENQNREIAKVQESDTEIAVKQAGISDVELALLADVKAGKPGAIKALAELGKIDLADAEDSEGDYTPEFKVEKKSDVDKAIASISADKELATQFNNTLATVPDDFIASISGDAKDLLRFAGHVKSGIAQELIPLATKASALNGKSLLENYVEIGEQKYLKAGKSKEEAKADNKPKREVTEKEKSLRERASKDADTNKTSSSSTVDDIWNMTAEEMNEKLANGEIDLRD